MATTLEYKCPCCGGAIEFDPNSQKMRCPYCDTEFDAETLRQNDEQLRKTDAPDEASWSSEAGEQWQQGETDGMRVYICNSCGGEIECDENTAASKCPYCDNPVVMTGQLSGVLKPDYIIPFKLDKKAAKEGLLKHISGKRLLPKIFKDKNHIDEIKGVYVPFWLFDAGADADIRYHATKVRTWSDSKNDYTETSHFAVYRAGNIAFERVPVDGSTRMPDDLMESIEPFDFSGAVDFQTAYLAGYLADKYDVDAQSSADRAKTRIKNSTEQEFAKTVLGYASVIPEQSSVRISGGNAKYALYPVWLLNTTYNGQKYTFAMNGQTGKFVGDLPLDKGAYAKWWGIIGGIAAAAVFAASYLLWLL